MTLIDQLWGTTNERIHTVGTLFIGFSALLASTLGLTVKENGLFTFGCFAIGIHLVGLAMLRNAWGRWRHDDDSLILLKKRGEDGKIHHVAVHALGYRLSWQGRVAHVDVGVFAMHPIGPQDRPSPGAVWSRSYQLFRAVYWFACSTVTFQLLFGISAVSYSVWLLDFLVTYHGSTLP